MWKCVCGEKIEDQFDICWSCGRDKEGKRHGQAFDIDTELEIQNRRTKTLREQKIVDTWATVIEGGQGRADFIFDKTQEFLAANEAPGVKWEMVEAQPGVIKGLFGKKRDYLLVTNESLKDYRMYIGPRDYGSNLDVAWFLTVEPGFFSSLMKMAIAVHTLGVFGHLDIFDQQDLRAYVTVSHHCLLDAVELLMQELGQDFSKVNTKSKGFLEVW